MTTAFTRPSLFGARSREELSALSSRFTAVYTGAITDVLDRRGYLHQTLPPEIAPLRPGMRLAGPA